MLRMMKTLPADCVASSMPSPVGELFMIASGQGLHAVLWQKDFAETADRQAFHALPSGDGHPVVRATKQQLKEYFAGKRSSFDIPLVLTGTPFQKQAWRQLQKIPYGQTISYIEQATRLGDPKKMRAVGGANGRNPISIIVPCHRVIAKSGGLGGFGGGLDSKRALLALEQASLR